VTEGRSRLRRSELAAQDFRELRIGLREFLRDAAALFSFQFCAVHPKDVRDCPPSAFKTGPLHITATPLGEFSLKGDGTNQEVYAPSAFKTAPLHITATPLGEFSLKGVGTNQEVFAPSA
jgi:hypothetical protein